MGVADDLDVAMETDEIKKEPAKKYFIDTNSIRVPRKGTEIQSFLKEGLGKSRGPDRLSVQLGIYYTRFL